MRQELVITLKRIEVNLCYEVGITLFARISRFPFAAETFSATLLTWRPRLARSQSVCGSSTQPRHVLKSRRPVHEHPRILQFCDPPGVCFHPARCRPVLLCHAASLTDCMYDCSALGRTRLALASASLSVSLQPFA